MGGGRGASGGASGEGGTGMGGGGSPHRQWRIFWTRPLIGGHWRGNKCEHAAVQVTERHRWSCMDPNALLKSYNSSSTWRSSSPCIADTATLRWGSQAAVGWDSGCGRRRCRCHSTTVHLRLCTPGRTPCDRRLPLPHPWGHPPRPLISVCLRCPPRNLQSPHPLPPTGSPLFPEKGNVWLIYWHLERV